MLLQRFGARWFSPGADPSAKDCALCKTYAVTSHEWLCNLLVRQGTHGVLQVRQTPVVTL